jgi:membrane protease YdiL (CAAX protease family)
VTELPENEKFEPLSRMQILVAMGVTALVLLTVAKLWQTFGNITLLPITWQNTDLLIGGGLALFITGASAIVYRIWPAYRRSADAYLELVLKPLVLPDIIWLGLLPGLSEELLFRGVMLSALGLNWLALIISSIVFGLLHISGKQQWPYAVWATCVGGVLGYSAIFTGNLLVPILAHILTNTISSLVWKLEQQKVN